MTGIGRPPINKDSAHSKFVRHIYTPLCQLSTIHSDIGDERTPQHRADNTINNSSAHIFFSYPTNIVPMHNSDDCECIYCYYYYVCNSS